MTPAGTSNELDVQNEWEENTHTHTLSSRRACRNIWFLTAQRDAFSRVSLVIRGAQASHSFQHPGYAPQPTLPSQAPAGPGGFPTMDSLRSKLANALLQSKVPGTASTVPSGAAQVCSAGYVGCSLGLKRILMEKSTHPLFP